MAHTCAEVPVSAPEEHRELVRKTLQALLADGHKPMTYYATDLKKYFYFGELMALVDLSLVRSVLMLARWSMQDL